MKLRWKYFLILVTASLVPLLTVTWISQNASRRLGKTISGKAQNTLTDTIKQEMVRSTRSYAAFSLLGGATTELALRVLAAKAELALALPPPSPTRVYYAADYDDPRSAPEDMSPSKNHPIRSTDGAASYKRVSHNHPNFLLAPGTMKEGVASDIARFTRLSSALISINQHYETGLHWVYASLENGVHIAYPGHGGYPAGYDPRQRPWYELAKKSEALSWLPIVDATTGQLLLTLSMPIRRPDGSFAGVAGMDIKITHALVESETTSRWSQKMSSFIVGAEASSGSKKRKIWVLSSGDQKTSPGSSSVGEISSRRPEFEELFRRINNQESGYLDMPYNGVDSLWAYAAMIANQYFVIVVPKSEIMTLPEEVGQMFVGYSKEQTTITGVAVRAGFIFRGYRGLFHLALKHRPYTIPLSMPGNGLQWATSR